MQWGGGEGLHTSVNYTNRGRRAEVGLLDALSDRQDNTATIWPGGGKDDIT